MLHPFCDLIPPAVSAAVYHCELTVYMLVLSFEPGMAAVSKCLSLSLLSLALSVRGADTVYDVLLWFVTTE